MSARDIYPRELLGLSRRLAYQDAGRGRPRTVALRRAVSSAYYALFHRISRDIAVELLGSAASPEAHAVVRWITHTDLGDLAKQVASPQSSIRQVIAAPSPELLAVCAALADLKNAREAADYNHEYSITKSNALDLVGRATDAHNLTVVMMGTPDASYVLFLKLALGGARIAAKRKS